MSTKTANYRSRTRALHREIADARRAALEQAAKVCEEYARSQRRHAPVQVAAGICAHRIRALLESGND